MERTGPAALLAAWEEGLAAGHGGRALLLHGVARPGAGTEELLSVPVGQRDADLFALRRALFGDRLAVRVECGECGEEMEFDFDPATLTGPAANSAGRSSPTVPRNREGRLRVEEDGWSVTFRLPTAGDLHEVEAAGPDDPDHARSLLITRCALAAERDGAPVAVGDLPALLPEKVRHRVAEAAAQADPGADVLLNVACPDCGRATRAELDISSYLWTELDAWARDTLLDVHLLATAYGWSEPEILALSPLRRRYYLELCADG
ncbi:hypothetical protein [Streptomyces sp. NPDC016845]|uniref:T4 family baseplate hub assembly chaperone n=1 Tax=Streptomyces sp. NPDC016845 TaxID=3364972 RepID=UPI0037B076CB